MKTLVIYVLSLVITLALLIGISSVAKAESWLLYQHKDWEVYYSDLGYLGANCSATVIDNGLEVAITAFDEGYVRLVIWDASKDWSEASGLRFNLQVDSYGVWTALNANTAGRVMAYTLSGPESVQFIKEIAVGQWLYVDYNEIGGNGLEWDVAFSLKGSAAAIAALDDCIRKF